MATFVLAVLAALLGVGLASAQAPEASTLVGGRVESAGAPLPDVQVTVERSHECSSSRCTPILDKDPNRAQVLTGPDGRWQARASPGTLRVTAEMSGFSTKTYWVTVDPGKSDSRVITLEPLQPVVLVKGVVRDFDTSHAVEGASVFVQHIETGHGSVVESDAQGRFEVRVPRGTATVMIQGEQTVSEYFTAVTTLVLAEEVAQETTFLLRPRIAPTAANVANTTVRGWVLDADGMQGIPGARIAFYNQQDFVWLKGETGMDGSFRAVLPEGAYNVLAMAAGYEDAWTATMANNIEQRTITLALRQGARNLAVCCWADTPHARGEAYQGPELVVPGPLDVGFNYPRGGLSGRDWVELPAAVGGDLGAYDPQYLPRAPAAFVVVALALGGAAYARRRLNPVLDGLA